MNHIAPRLQKVHDRIAAACGRAGRDVSEVQLISVTKTRPLEQVRELYELGPRDFAENRAQDARHRIPEMPNDIAWHFIGPLQTNKVKYLPGLFTCIHSVDRLEVAEAIDKAWQKHPDLPPVRVFLQFNISGEEQKHGATEEEAQTFLRQVLQLSRLSVEGLMCMAPYGDDPELVRPVFRELRLLRDRLQKASGHPLPQLSMGMTGDFEVAIEEGSTMVRIGTALFED